MSIANIMLIAGITIIILCVLFRKKINEKRRLSPRFESYCKTAERFLAGIVCLIPIYVVIVIGTIFISMRYSNDLFGIETKQAMSENGCHIPYKERAVNHLRVWEFYADLDYWLSEYRTHINFMDRDECMLLLLSLLEMPKSSKGAQVAFIDDEGKVVFVLTNKGLQR
ncbi:MAG: hypothetical protein FWH15_05365 [Betaproteobacteria bacterium]|nr:hypothetical protein [Betaproteobacteria bacterium]